MFDYHWDPGNIKLGKGVVRVEDRCSLNIHQRDGHCNKRRKQHCMSACKKVSVSNTSSPTMLKSKFHIELFECSNVSKIFERY